MASACQHRASQEFVVFSGASAVPFFCYIIAFPTDEKMLIFVSSVFSIFFQNETSFPKWSFLHGRLAFGLLLLMRGFHPAPRLWYRDVCSLFWIICVEMQTFAFLFSCWICVAVIVLLFLAMQIIFLFEIVDFGRLDLGWLKTIDFGMCDISADFWTFLFCY